MALRMRRFSTAVAGAATAPAKMPRFAMPQFLKQVPIEELPEMTAISTVQTIVQRLPEEKTTANVSKFQDWLATFKQEQDHTTGSLMDKAAFERYVNASAGVAKAEEDALWSANPLIALRVDTEDYSSSKSADDYLEAVRLSLIRHKCAQVLSMFELLDKDQDGHIKVEDCEALIDVMVRGDGGEWLKALFDMIDADSDNEVTQDESKRVLDTIVTTQRNVLAEIFGTHVDNMPKKHMKLLERSVYEENWKSKIPEKIRCVWHFALRHEDDKTLDWEGFRESQIIEFPEAHNLLAVYSKGFYDERYTFHERKRETRSTRVKGLALATAIGVGDYVAMIV